MFKRFALPWGMSVRFAGSLFLFAALSTAGAQAAPGETPFTLARFNAWVKKLCAQHTCQPIKVESLPLGNAVPAEAKAMAVGRGDLRMGLLHNVNTLSGKAAFGEISFVPLRAMDRWTPERMAFAAKALLALSGGKLSVKTMQECVASIKRNGYTGDSFLENDPIRVLISKPVSTGIAGCKWLPSKKNVTFGFEGFPMGV